MAILFRLLISCLFLSSHESRQLFLSHLPKMPDCRCNGQGTSLLKGAFQKEFKQLSHTYFFTLNELCVSKMEIGE